MERIYQIKVQIIMSGLRALRVAMLRTIRASSHTLKYSAGTEPWTPS